MPRLSTLSILQPMAELLGLELDGAVFVWFPFAWVAPRGGVLSLTGPWPSCRLSWVWSQGMRGLNKGTGSIGIIGEWV